MVDLACHRRDRRMTTTRTLDRIPHFDPRSRSFGIQPVTAAKAPRNCRWRTGVVLDQGREGACVGFGWTAELGATPRVVPINDTFAMINYRLSQGVDRSEGRYYDSGATVLAGAKVMKASGFIKEYRWCFGLTDLVLALSWNGPVVLGIDWYDSMYEAPGGVVTVAGQIVGGHCILAVGVDTKGKTVTLRNSWGADWGIKGDAKISWADLARLLQAGGEACVPIGRSTGPVKQTLISRLGLSA